MLTYEELNELSQLPILQKVNKNITADMIASELLAYHPDVYNQIIKSIEERNTDINHNIEIKLAEDTVYDFIQMLEMIIATKKINAIKLARGIGGLSLKEAKEYIESITVQEAQRCINNIGEKYPALVV